MTDAKNEVIKSVCLTISGYVQLRPLALKIVDSPWFQRLRYLKQMGVAYLVYPCATETRFEHSIGTYGLAGDLLGSLRRNSDRNELNKGLKNIPELQDHFSTKKADEEFLDDHVCELIKLSALCHDIGHGPFSHTYDDYLGQIYGSEYQHHEERSQIIVDKLLRGVVKDCELEFIKILIDPPKERDGFVYQIVCNKKNSIDVDKLDYVNRDSRAIGKSFRFDTTPLIQQARVIDNDLCYPGRMAYEITGLFTLRYMLFKQVCSNKTIIAIQHMIHHLFQLIDPYIDLRCEGGMDGFCRLTDEFIRCFPKITELKDDAITQAKKLLDDIEHRKIYRRIDNQIFRSSEKCDEFYKEMLEKYPNDRYIVHKGKIGLVPNDVTDLFENIYFYSNKEPNSKFLLERDEISSILPDNCFEYFVMVFDLNL